MAELAPVGWVLSPIMKIVVDKAKLYLGSQYNWEKDMQKNLEKLENTLVGIKTVVDAAEQLQSKNPSQKQLLYQLKDTIYEADDLLDEFDYRILETKAMEDRGWVSHGAFSSLTFAKRLIGQDKLLSKLKEFLNKLDTVKKNVELLNVQAARCERSNAIRITSSFPPSETFGRDKEKEELINLLLNKPESSHTNIPVIPIVGVGGIGKTTLAQLVYNEKKIIKKFKRRIWICVSDDFNVIMITRKILESASGSNGKHKDVLNFDVLQKELQNELQSEEFLLVLDDVWWDEKKDRLNQEMWENLLAPLQKGKSGSKILVTTRERRVAKMFNAMSSMIPLASLTSKDTWSLLKKYAFNNKNPDEYPELQKIGMQITEKLSGSPLAAKVVGATLNDRLDVEHWLDISKRKIFDNVTSILGLSYQCLPDHLKHCFAYCSIFPKDWTFEREKLVLLWIAQGYVLPDGTERPLRDIGIDYFNQLLSRSLFEEVEQRYVMHDLIHDLTEGISKDECFRIDGGKQGKMLETVRHLGIIINCVGELQDIFTQLEKMRNLKNLRTLMLFGNSSWRCADHLFGILKELKSLRVLDFGSWLELQIPKTLCHCLHLRYLNLGQLSSGILPKSLSRLYHLQVLVAHELPLSGSMFRLLKFGELKFLAVRRLEFKVERKEHHRIGVLMEMGMETAVEGDLRILKLENVTDKAEAAEADIGSKLYLDGLKLHWDSSAARINGHDADQEVAEVLKPHPNLKRVTIKGFRGSRCPGWLESKWLDSLQSLSLIRCSELEVLPPLDHLRLLKECTVKQCSKLMSFPRFPPTLKKIVITKTGINLDLSLWPSSSPECFRLSTNSISIHTALLHDHHLQAIQDLHISDCKESMPAKWLLRLAALKRLGMYRCQKWMMSDEEEDGGGVLHSSLESLTLLECPVTERLLSRCLQGLTSLKELTLMYCPELKSLPQEDGCGVLTTSLESLKIHSCLVTDLSLISHYTSLKKLIIEGCPELKSLPQEDGANVLATSLESLEIRDCPVTGLSLISHCTSLKKLTLIDYPVIERSLSGCLQGLTSLEKLTLIRCPELKSLPQEDGGGVLATSLESLKIYSCPVTDLSLISHCTSLKKLIIGRCPELKSLPQEDGGSVLATSLESLEIRDCPVTDLSLIFHCTSLKSLTIGDCPELKSLPEGLPTSLEEVHFVGCGVPKETVVRCLQGLPSLSKLTVDFWTHFTTLSSLHHLDVKKYSLCEPSSKVELPESLQSLHISGCDVSDTFLCTCLQGLASLSELVILCCNGLTSLPPAQVLQRLTTLKKLHISCCDELMSLGALHALASLKEVYVENCPKLKSLPKEGLPSSIQKLTLLISHPKLKQQIHKKKGPNWAKIAHIPSVHIS